MLGANTYWALARECNTIFFFFLLLFATYTHIHTQKGKAVDQHESGSKARSTILSETGKDGVHAPVASAIMTPLSKVPKNTTDASSVAPFTATPVQVSGRAYMCVCMCVCVCVRVCVKRGGRSKFTVGSVPTQVMYSQHPTQTKACALTVRKARVSLEFVGQRCLSCFADAPNTHLTLLSTKTSMLMRLVCF